MVWGATSDRDDQRQRSDALTAAYRGPRGIPHVSDAQAGILPRGNSGAELERRIASGAGSRGGAPIWVCKKGWEPEEMKHAEKHAKGICSCFNRSVAEGRKDAQGYRDALSGLKRLSRNTDEMNSGAQRGAIEPERNEADPDGFAVFGRYPKGFLDHVIKAQWLGRIRRDEILHVCSGTLSESETWTVDLRAPARPRVMADGKCLPFRDASFKAVMMDPPYSDEYARNLYGVENPRPSWLLKEAARVVQPSGRIGILHVAIPFAPPGCFLCDVWPVTTGVGFKIRALTVYEKFQDSLFSE